uniref:Secreted protein n=1 Tax=Anopheles funestus TaxID=62324 RepID=A0A4Y0BH07_ANOFN
MVSLSSLFPVLLVCAILTVDTIEGTRQDALTAFQPLKTSAKGKQQRKLIAGGSELFISLQSELILTQEPYVQQTIDEETNIQGRLTPIADTKCAQLVASGTDLLMELVGLSFRNCVAKIDDEMFARLYPQQDNSSRQQYAKASLLSSFRDVNIFIEPLTIQLRIQEKLNNPVALEGITGEMAVALKTAFQECLTNARTLMMQSLRDASTQADSICVN